MRLLLSFIVLLFLSTNAEAQLFKPKNNAPINAKYSTGAVTKENNRIVFRKSIDAQGLGAQEIKEMVKGWYNRRFEPSKIISAKTVTDTGTQFEARIEEYITFKNRFFVLDRSRIYYYLTVYYSDNRCEIAISRITYWYDEENSDGGMRYTAEEIITDENSLKNGKLKKHPGKFRTKTIDLKDSIFNELENTLKSNR